MSDAGTLLALIPARGGSKRIPRKNVLPLGGRPLIAWTIDAALAAGLFEEVIVSTDDQEIAHVAGHYGARVPWLRPAELATDTARSADVIKHALAWYTAQGHDVDAVVLLQPTSPFRSAESIRGAVSRYSRLSVKAPVVSVSPAATHPAWCFRLSETGMTPFLGWDQVDRRSQDLPRAYALNGAIYVFPADHIRADRPLVSPETQAFVMDDPDEALDIDTQADWLAATQIAQRFPALETAHVQRPT